MEDFLPTSRFFNRISRRNAHLDAKPFTASRPGSIRGDPCQSDILILEATIPGFVSYRNPNLGSWLVTCIDRVFRQYAEFLDIRDLFDKVSEMMRDMTTDEGAKQIPEMRTRAFYNKLWLRPNFEMDPEECEDEENLNIENRTLTLSEKSEKSSTQCQCVIC